MIKVAAPDLKSLIIRTLKVNKITNLKIGDGNPFYVTIENNEFLFFLKNITPAYFKYNSDITRIQVPSSNHFQNISINLNVIIIGYDEFNDVIVIWESKKIKPRLNMKANISLYSRQSIQDSVTYTEIKTGYLSNNDKIILAKRKNILLLLNSIIEENKTESQKNNFQITEITSDENSEIEFEISNLGEEFMNLVIKDEKLNAVQLLMSQLEKNNSKLTLSDCTKYLKKHYFRTIKSD
jgi:hypothetical protein